MHNLIRLLDGQARLVEDDPWHWLADPEQPAANGRLILPVAAWLQRQDEATLTGGPAKKIDPIMPYIAPGSTVIDIGASMGFFSRRFARKAGLVIAFEPQGMSRAIMTVASFFRRNQNIMLMPFALGAQDGLLPLSIPIKKGRKVGTSLAHIGNDEDFADRFSVEKELVACTTLDSALSHRVHDRILGIFERLHDVLGVLIP